MTTGTLRACMPQTAEIVDWLRRELGAEKSNAILLRGKQGRGGFYAAEIGPDGVFREFGSTSSRKRARPCQDGTLRWDESGAN